MEDLIWGTTIEHSPLLDETSNNWESRLLFILGPCFNKGLPQGGRWRQTNTNLSNSVIPPELQGPTRQKRTGRVWHRVDGYGKGAPIGSTAAEDNTSTANSPELLDLDASFDEI